jgi:hypothetical protein
MQATFSRELADQRIADFHRQAGKDRLVREARQARRAAARRALRALLGRSVVPAAGRAGHAGADRLAELRDDPAHPRSGEGG